MHSAQTAHSAQAAHSAQCTVHSAQAAHSTQQFLTTMTTVENLSDLFLKASLSTISFKVQNYPTCREKSFLHLKITSQLHSTPI